MFAGIGPVAARFRLMRAALLGLGTALAVTAAPAVIAYAIHVASYDGFCGPHAPDISRHPCSWRTHHAEFGSGFEGAGLWMLTIPAALVGLVAGAVVFTRARRRAADRGKAD
jgi:hypothetical protein